MYHDILRDIAVAIASEFDLNFQRQAFFDRPWPPHATSVLRPGGHILVSTGQLRASILTDVRANDQGGSVTFRSDLPYAAIHNQGGTVTVTPKMRRYFWARHYEAQGKQKKRSSSSLTPEAEFWRNMALKPVGSLINIPQRQFIGSHPAVTRRCEDIIRRALDNHFRHLDLD